MSKTPVNFKSQEWSQNKSFEPRKHLHRMVINARLRNLILQIMPRHLIGEVICTAGSKSHGCDPSIHTRSFISRRSWNLWTAESTRSQIPKYTQMGKSGKSHYTRLHALTLLAMSLAGFDLTLWVPDMSFSRGARRRELHKRMGRVSGRSIQVVTRLALILWTRR